MDQAYLDWVKKEALAIHSDGCSVMGGLDHQLYEICCFEHDLGYYYAKDPRDAYRLYLASDTLYWEHSKDISRREVDHRFRLCNEEKSKLGKFSPVAWLRWIGVRSGGWRPWAEHRRQEQNT